MNSSDEILFEALGPIKKGKITIGYAIKDRFGNIKNVSNSEIRAYIKSGAHIKGLKLTSDDRVIVDRVSYGILSGTDNTSDNISVLSGQTLINICKSRVSKYKPRQYVNNIVKFALNYEYDRLFIVHGIRRTGKTVSFMHSILELVNSGLNLNNVFYININNNRATFKRLVNILRGIHDSVVFIDEITFIPEIIREINYLVDILSAENRIKIIIAGTDSFVFPIAQIGSLFGRTHTVHSTYISYEEYIYILGLGASEYSYKQYIKDGTLYGNEYSGFDNMHKKLHGAVIKNIENTLTRNRQSMASDTFYIDMAKYSSGDMLFLIYNILISATSPKSLNSITDITRGVIGKEKLSFLSSAFGVNNSEITRKLSGVSNESLKTMVSALEELDIVNRVNNLAGFVSSDEAEYRSVTDQEICINIPGLLDTLLSVLNTTPDKVSGTENENIILSALCRLKPRVYEVYYLKFQVSGREHEIDAVVQVRDPVSFDIKYILIEVKTDKKDKSEYAQHLISQDLPEVIKQNTSKRIVVYMGENKIKTFGKYKVQYINIVEFLSNIEKYLGI